MSNQAVKRTERGWVGHYCMGDRCRFRRNTLLECGHVRIVVSTVGMQRVSPGTGSDEKFEMIGYNRYFETMAFHAKHDGRYWDADVSKQVDFESPWAIDVADADDRANDMHEAVVAELTEKLGLQEIMPPTL